MDVVILVFVKRESLPPKNPFVALEKKIKTMERVYNELYYTGGTQTFEYLKTLGSLITSMRVA